MIRRAQLFVALLFSIMALLYIWGIWIPAQEWKARVTTTMALGLVYYYGRSRAEREREELRDNLVRWRDALEGKRVDALD